MIDLFYRKYIKIIVCILDRRIKGKKKKKTFEINTEIFSKLLITLPLNQVMYQELLIISSTL